MSLRVPKFLHLLLLSLCALGLGCTTVTERGSSTPNLGDSRPIHYTDLRTEHFVVGVSPSVGGRIYKLVANGQNIIAWDENFLFKWNRKGHYPYHLYGGQEIWFSPQSEWPKAWPPALNITTNPWRVLDASDGHIHMVSRESKNKWQASREIRLLSPRSFTNTMTLRNAGEGARNLGIWTMTRCPRGSSVLIPVSSEGKNELSIERLSKSVQEGFSRVVISGLESKKLSYRGETLVMRVELGPASWEVKIEYSHAGAVHPEQARFEIFPVKGLVEVEHHGPYVGVLPGHAIWVRETWSLLNVKEVAKQE